MRRAIKIEDKDNVITATTAFNKGDTYKIDGKTITINEDIPRFHKIAIEDINKGELVYKYGQIIGDALSDIKAGDWVHVDNVESTRGRGDKENK